MPDEFFILQNKLVQIAYSLDCCIDLFDHLLSDMKIPEEQAIVTVFLDALKHTNQDLQDIPDRLDRLLINESKARKKETLTS